MASATGLVFRKYLNIRKSEKDTENEMFRNEISPKVIEETEVEEEDEEPEPLGISHNVTSGFLPYTPANESVQVAQKHDHRNDTSLFAEQFFPQDSKTTGDYSTKPTWLKQVNEFKYKEEREADAPTPDDVFKLQERRKIREMGDRYTEKTIHENKSKNHESPDETGIWTGNANRLTDGFHPKNMNQLHSILPPLNETINIHSTVQGMVGFKSDNVSQTLTEDKKEKKSAVFKGIPTGPVEKQSSEYSFETQASNAENYNLSKQYASSSHAPVSKVTYKNNETVDAAHDEELNTFMNLIESSMFRRSKGDGNMEKSETVFKSKEIERPVIAGSKGGVITLPVSTNSEVKTSGSKEALGLRSSSILSNVGASSFRTKATNESDMMMAEPRLFESENTSSGRKTTSNLKKNFQVGGEFSTNDDRENINATEFTSDNIRVKPNESLGINKFNPTGSMSLGRENSFKEESGVSEFSSKLGFGFDRTKFNNRSVVSKEMEEKQDKSLFETIFNDRLKLGAGFKSIDTRKDLSRNFNVDV